MDTTDTGCTDDKPCIYVGRKFSSYKELSECVIEYENRVKQKFYKKRSRTIANARKNLQRELKESLQFYEIEFECIHGKERQKRGNGLRQTSTFRLGCKAHFKLRVCTMGDYLNVYSVNLTHTNHDHSKTRKKFGKKSTLEDLHNNHYIINDFEEAIPIEETKYCAKPKCSLKEEKKIMTLTEKQKVATLVTDSLVNLLSLSSDSEFSDKLELLQELEHAWRIGKTVALEVADCTEENQGDFPNNIFVENDENIDIKPIVLIDRLKVDEIDCDWIKKEEK